jgi:hypothetical protein
MLDAEHTDGASFARKQKKYQTRPWFVVEKGTRRTPG